MSEFMNEEVVVDEVVEEVVNDVTFEESEVEPTYELSESNDSCSPEVSMEEPSTGSSGIGLLSGVIIAGGAALIGAAIYGGKKLCEKHPEIKEKIPFVNSKAKKKREMKKLAKWYAEGIRKGFIESDSIEMHDDVEEGDDVNLDEDGEVKE